GHRIRQFVQGVADRDFGGDPGDRITGGLGGEGAGPADPGIHFDDVIPVAFGIQGELDIAAAADVQGADDAQGGGAQALVVPIRQRLGGGDHDAVPGVDPHRIHVFHVADHDAVVGGIPHHFVFDLLVAGDAFFDEALADRAASQPVLGDLPQFLLTAGD